MSAGQQKQAVSRCLCGLFLVVTTHLQAADLASPKLDAPAAEEPTAGPVELPTLPAVRLAVPEPYKDEQAYLGAKRAEVDGLVALAEQTDDPLEQCRHRLSAANMILSYLIEPACSARLLRIEPAAQPPDVDDVRKTLDDADRLLRRVDETLVQLAKANETPDPMVSGFRHALETLDAFREAIQIYLLSDAASEESVALTRRGASRLSAWLEDDDERIRITATFWQACLRDRVSKPKRVRQLLGSVLADAPTGAVRAAFFSRLLSCRILAKTEGYVTSLALLTQLEARCDRWFISEADEHNASRAVALVEMQVVSDWYRRLADSKDDTVLTWCVERIKKLTEEHFAEDALTVLRLSPAVPILKLPEQQQPGRSEPEAQAPGQSEPRR
ncbi:MAG: hypothetical protein IH897_00075 [Planctomycetes bacterium]|nr:hypothetical protein [Planctomycetota bacterium]